MPTSERIATPTMPMASVTSTREKPGRTDEGLRGGFIGKRLFGLIHLVGVEGHRDVAVRAEGECRELVF